jgi:hypothetical protein
MHDAVVVLTEPQSFVGVDGKWSSQFLSKLWGALQNVDR